MYVNNDMDINRIK